jgi:hypothetical protein
MRGFGWFVDTANLGLKAVLEKGIRLKIKFSWTGYKKVSKDVFSLIDAINLAFSRPEFRPRDGITYCNQFVTEVCTKYGFKGLEGLLANQMIDAIEKSQDWSIVDMSKCQELVNQGTLIIAGLKDEPHGHVVVICPGKEKTSGRWGTVPTCANIGKDVRIGSGVNWAFSDLPKFYAWRQSL